MQFIKNIFGALFWAVVLMVNPVPEMEEPALLHMEQAKAALSLEGIMLYDFNAMWMGDAFAAFAMPHYRSRSDTEDLRLLALETLDGILAGILKRWMRRRSRHFCGHAARK